MRCSKELNLKVAVFSFDHSFNSVSLASIPTSWKKLWSTMKASSQEIEEWDTEDDLPIDDCLDKFSERGL